MYKIGRHRMVGSYDGSERVPRVVVTSSRSANAGGDLSYGLHSDDAGRDGPLPKTLVIQAGARRGYVLPRMLEQAGALHAFHTTFAIPDRAPSLAVRLARQAMPRRGATFDRRGVRGVPADKVFPHASADIARQVAERLGRDRMACRRIASAALGRRTLATLTPGADTVLAVDGNGGPDCLAALKARGLRIAVDIAVTPTALDATAAAALVHPQWGRNIPSPAERAGLRDWYATAVAIADLVLYPSDGVLAGLRTLDTFDENRARHVPYALGTLTPRPAATVPGRIFFAGSDPVRKGLPELVAAVRRLGAGGPAVELVVAGLMPEAVRRLPECDGVTFLGHVGSTRMAEEMAKADVFCLPSHAEGTAGVTLEALASGIPCVVTLAAGAPVAHGVDGLIVPEGNIDALAEALAHVVGDRALRARMADAALARRGAFDPAVVRDTLIAVLAAPPPEATGR